MLWLVLACAAAIGAFGQQVRAPELQRRNRKLAFKRSRRLLRDSEYYSPESRK